MKSWRTVLLGILCALILWAATGSQITFLLGTAPSNPSAGRIRLWANTGSGFLECLNSSGAACMPVPVAHGTSALGTGAISSATCASVVTTSATGTLTTDVIQVSFNSDPTGVTGYVPSTSGMLTIFPYPTADNVNFKVCNNTSSSVTPGAITLNWRVVR